MSNSIKGLILYTQNDCPYCDIMKTKLKEWGYNWDEVNISYQIEQKQFLKEHGHRTVPVLYWNKTHLNKVNTQEFTHKIMKDEMDLENYVGGVENF